MTTTSTALFGTIAGPKSIGNTVSLSPDFMDAGHISAIQETSAGVRTVLSAGVHYDFTLDGAAPSSGTFEFLYNLSSGDSVHWVRITTLDQQTALSAIGAFPTTSVERAFDKAILALQEPTRVAPARLRSMTPTANWTVPTAAYYEHGGLIRMEGTAQSVAGVVFAETITTLPSGSRPTKTSGFSVACLVSGASNYVTVPILIDTSGNVTYRGAASGASIVTLYLEGIAFRY